jgi:DNA-binding MarR family transcriptional regulator
MIVMTHHNPVGDDVTETLAPVDLGPLAMMMGYALRRAQLAIFTDFHRRFAAEDIRPAQYSVMLVLRQNPGLRQSQVSMALGIKGTNFVPLFDSLEDRGLAERRRAPDDRRASALYLTPVGETLLGQLDEIVAAHEAHFAARIGPDGKARLLDLLRRLTDEG